LSHKKHHPQRLVPRLLTSNYFYVLSIRTTSQVKVKMQKQQENGYPFAEDLEGKAFPSMHQDNQVASSTTRTPIASLTSGKIYSGQRRARLTSMIVGMIVLVVAGLSVFLYLDRNGIRFGNKSPSSSLAFLGTVSSSELAVHDVPNDCWLALHGNVYDLTQYAPQHPGGAELITNWCGADGTAAFSNQHKEAYLQRVSAVLLGEYTTNTASVPTSTAKTTTGESSGSSANPAQSPSSATSPAQSPPDEEDYAGGYGSTATASAPAPSPNVPTPPTYPAQTPTTSAQAPTTAPTAAATCQQQIYTVSDVASHGNQNDCWYVLYGSVYDLTDYVNVHPGGPSRIIQECGTTDATPAFSSIKNHNQALLAKQGRYSIGQLGTQSGLLNVPC
jgi:cytochrome b involved in lipid metabolism